MNVYRSALSIGVVSNLPNVSEFTWPRDRDLPPPAFVPTQASLEQAAIAMEESTASSDERVLDDEEDDEPVNQEVADEAGEDYGAYSPSMFPLPDNLRRNWIKKPTARFWESFVLYS